MLLKKTVRDCYRERFAGACRRILKYNYGAESQKAIQAQKRQLM